MSFILRNLACFRRRTGSAFKFQTFATYFSREESNTYSVVTELENDTSTIFDYIEKNQECLSGQNCLEMLKKFSEHSILDFRSNSVTEKKYLLIVCNELDKQVNNLCFSETIEAVELLCKLKMPTSSIILQSLLKKIQRDIGCLTNINDTEMVELQTLLSKMKNCDLAKTIRNDLSIAIKSSRQQQNLNIASMCSDLYKAVNSKHVNRELIVSILHGISSYSGEIPVFTALSIYISCLKFPDINVAENVDLKRVENTIINNVSKLKHENIYTILEKLSTMSMQKNLPDIMYNPDLIDSLIEVELSTNTMYLENGLRILWHLKLIGHVHTKLVDYLMMKCFENQFLIWNLPKLDLLRFTEGLGVCIEKPPLWDSIKHCIVNHKEFKAMDRFACIHLAYNLSLLHYPPSNLISIAFQQRDGEFQKFYTYTQQRILFLYQVAKTLDPTYTGPWPSTFLLKFILQQDSVISYCSTNDSVLNTLEKALGGAEYVRSNMKTSLGHYINHIVVMRKGGFPVAINHADNGNDSFCVEDIVVPPESQIIAILYFESDNYLRNVNQLRREFILYIKSLEALKYDVIPVDLREWTNLSEKNKIPFLMSQIKSRSPTDENLAFLSTTKTR